MEKTSKSAEQLRDEGYVLVSRKSYEIKKECNHDWEYGQVILGQTITPRKCSDCGKIEI